MKLNLPLLGVALGLTVSTVAQDVNRVIPHRTCGTESPSPEWDTWFNGKVEEYKQLLASGKTQQVNHVIPVIVHIVHGPTFPAGSYPNLSAAQVNSQINVLNADFAGTGLNVGNLASTGFSVVGAANTGITFCAATKDPTGATLAEPGIDRINYSSKGWSNPTSFTSPSTFQNYINNTVKPGSIWDPTKYLNVWVTDCNQNVGLLGYATFPAGSGLTGIPGGTGTSLSDGVWVWSGAYGNTGTLAAPYDKGRTATHEIGHWLGLRHIGGDSFNTSGDCNATDYCNDTPPQKGGAFGGTNGQNYGGPSYPLNTTGTQSCALAAPYGDMFMNFMDYTDDAFMYMFTPDQSTRIQTTMQNGTYRSGLSASSATACGTSTGLDAIRDFHNSVALFPNPAKNTVSIAYSGATALSVSVVNALGQIVISSEFPKGSNEYRLNLTGLAAGVYLVNLNDGTNKIVKRLIVE